MDAKNITSRLFKASADIFIKKINQNHRFSFTKKITKHGLEINWLNKNLFNHFNSQALAHITVFIVFNQPTAYHFSLQTHFQTH